MDILFKPKIKIIDDALLRNELVNLFIHKTHKTIVKWAIFLIKETMSIYSFNQEQKKEIFDAILLMDNWENDLSKLSLIRTRAFLFHKYAREAQNQKEKIAFRVIAQSVSSCHVKEHALIASDYQVKLNNYESSKDISLSKNLRKRQIDELKKI